MLEYIERKKVGMLPLQDGQTSKDRATQPMDHGLLR